MSEQEEFEKWARKDYGLKKKKNGAYRYLRTESAADGWQACAERKDKIIEQHLGLLNLYSEIVEEMRQEIEHQTAELAALRGFAKAIQYDLEPENWGAYPKGLLKIYKLIDENGNPTKLLTGE